MKSAAMLFAAVALTMGMQSCTSVKQLTSEDLSGYWALKTMDGEAAEDAFKGSIPSLSFDFEKNTINGNSGCNTFSGAYTLDEKNTFSAPRLAATMRMCMDANKEPQFQKHLSTEATLSLIEGVLSFKSNGKVTLEFIQGEAPKAAPVSGEALAHEWTLASINGKLANEVYSENVPSMTINADGSVNGNAGCNNYRTNYKLDGDVISFGVVMSTKMACPDLEGETLFTAALTSPLKVTIVENKLKLSKDGVVVLEFTK